MDIIACHSHTHQGPYLSLNEDIYHYDFDNDIYMVIDAFGGNGAGDEVLKLIVDNMGKFYENITQDPEATQPFFYNPQFSLEANALINALTYTHKLVLKKNSLKNLGERAGASGVFLVKNNHNIDILNIGSTQAMLFRDNTLHMISKEQSLNSLHHADHSRVPQFAIGLNEDFHYQIQSVKAEKNDQVFLATDGAYAYLKEADYQEYLSSEAAKVVSIENLFQLANNRGNQDNQTLMILEF